MANSQREQTGGVIPPGDSSSSKAPLESRKLRARRVACNLGTPDVVGLLQLFGPGFIKVRAKHTLAIKVSHMLVADWRRRTLLWDPATKHASRCCL
jgi:hypothetical protein